MENLFHVSASIFVSIYGLYNVHQFSNGISTNASPEVFAEGWSIIGRSKDISDYEWNAWKSFLLPFIPWLFIHFFGAECLRHNKKYLQFWYCAISIVFIIYKYGTLSLFLFSMQPCIYLLILQLGGSSLAIWVCSSVLLIAVNYLKTFYDNISNYRFFGSGHMTDDDLYMVMITVSWIQLRAISFSLECVKLVPENKNTDKKLSPQVPDILDVFSYIFYLPLFFLGPILLYNDFEKSYKHKTEKSLQYRFNCLFKNLIRYLGWFFFIELVSHYFYFNALQYNPEVIAILPDWCLYGGGIWMGLHFYLKYLVVYGLSGSLVAMDYINPESPPRCILRVHLYSQMWKYFDVGLYKFLIRYIYKPIIEATYKKQDKQLYLYIMKYFASFVCFAFIYTWHGTHHFIFVWTLLNFIGIVIESLAIQITKFQRYKIFQSSMLKTRKNNERFNALLSTPILIMSALSNFYFFAGSEIGDIYVARVLNQSFSSLMIMIFFMYSLCRSSQYFSNVTARKIHT